MAENSNLNIAIIGAGIAGLSLALNLKKRGIAAQVFERVPDVTEIVRLLS